MVTAEGVLVVMMWGAKSREGLKVEEVGDLRQLCQANLQMGEQMFNASVCEVKAPNEGFA